MTMTITNRFTTVSLRVVLLLTSLCSIVVMYLCGSGLCGSMIEAVSIFERAVCTCGGINGDLSGCTCSLRDNLCNLQTPFWLTRVKFYHITLPIFSTKVLVGLDDKYRHKDTCHHPISGPFVGMLEFSFLQPSLKLWASLFQLGSCRFRCRSGLLAFSRTRQNFRRLFNINVYEQIESISMVIGTSNTVLFFTCDGAMEVLFNYVDYTNRSYERLPDVAVRVHLASSPISRVGTNWFYGASLEYCIMYGRGIDISISFWAIFLVEYLKSRLGTTHELSRLSDNYRHTAKGYLTMFRSPIGVLHFLLLQPRVRLWASLFQQDSCRSRCRGGLCVLSYIRQNSECYLNINVCERIETFSMGGRTSHTLLFFFLVDALKVLFNLLFLYK